MDMPKKNTLDWWKKEAEERKIILSPEDNTIAEIKAKVEAYDLANKAPEEKAPEEKANTLKIKIKAGVRHNGVRTSEITEIEVKEEDLPKYEHVKAE